MTAEGVSHLFRRKSLSVPYPDEQLDIQEDVEQLLAPDAVVMLETRACSCLRDS